MHIDWGWFKSGISGQTIILFLGGLFLLYKSTSEIHEKVEMPEHSEESLRSKKISTLSSAIVQIILIDFIFSIDSILTAIGMTNGITPNHNDALILMIIAVVISIIVMMILQIRFVNLFTKIHPCKSLGWLSLYSLDLCLLPKPLTYPIQVYLAM